MFLIDLHLTHLNVVLLVLFDVQRASRACLCLSKLLLPHETWEESVLPRVS